MKPVRIRILDVKIVLVESAFFTLLWAELACHLFPQISLACMYGKLADGTPVINAGTPMAASKRPDSKRRQI